MNKADFRRIISPRAAAGPWEDYLECYEAHLSLREVQVPAHKSSGWGDPAQARANTSALLQALLHRATMLFEGAVNAAEDDNPYSMFLSIRGHFETSAALGYLHTKLETLRGGDLSLAGYQKEMTTLLLGTRDQSVSASLLKKHDEVLQATNVLTMLKHADRTTNKEVLGGSPDHKTPLSDEYSWLSEVCHPNVLSSLLSFDIDHSIPAYVFRHDQPMRERDLRILSHLIISGKVFVVMFEKARDLAAEAFALEDESVAS